MNSGNKNEACPLLRRAEDGICEKKVIWKQRTFEDNECVTESNGKDEEIVSHQPPTVHTSSNEDGDDVVSSHKPNVSRAPREEETEENSSYWKSTAAACSAVFVLFYQMISLYPYAGFMAVHLVEGVTQETAGRHTGMLTSSFMLGRAISAYGWGKVADIYGRKPVLILSLISSAILSILFGLSRTYTMAVAIRFISGLGNGTMVGACCLASELSKGDKAKETRGFSIIAVMYGYGILISPAVAGALSEPRDLYPNVHWNVGILSLDEWLDDFPFVLPNVLGTILSVLSLALVFMWVEETLPPWKRRDSRFMMLDLASWVCSVTGFDCKRLCWYQGHIMDEVRCRFRFDDAHNAHGWRRVMPTHDIAEESVESDCGVMFPDAPHSAGGNQKGRTKVLVTHLSMDEDISETAMEAKGHDETATMTFLLSQKNIRIHLLALWGYCFVHSNIDVAFSLFCMSRVGGLGIDESLIGLVMSGAGIVFCLTFYFIFSRIVDTMGIYRALRVGALLSIIPASLFPLATVLNRDVAMGAANAATFVYLSFIMALTKIFGALFMSTMIIALNRLSGVSYRATLNGLASLGDSVANAVGPAFSGFLVSYAFSGTGIIPPRFGSEFVFGVIGFLGFVFLAVTLFLDENGGIKNAPSTSSKPGPDSSKHLLDASVP